MKHDLFLFVQFSFPQKLIMDCFNFSKAALSFYKWYHYNEKIFDFFCILFFLKNILIRGNPIKMCCFEVLKINRCSGVTQIVRSLWKRRGENCFCITSDISLVFFVLNCKLNIVFFSSWDKKKVHSLSRWACNFVNYFDKKVIDFSAARLPKQMMVWRRSCSPLKGIWDRWDRWTNRKVNRE